MKVLFCFTPLLFLFQFSVMAQFVWSYPVSIKENAQDFPTGNYFDTLKAGADNDGNLLACYANCLSLYSLHTGANDTDWGNSSLIYQGAGCELGVVGLVSPDTLKWATIWEERQCPEYTETSEDSGFYYYDSNIYISSTVDGGITWDPPRSLSNLTSDSEFYPGLGIDKNGNWVAAWITDFGAGHDWFEIPGYLVTASSVDNGITWNSPQVLQTHSPSTWIQYYDVVDYDHEPKIATDSAGTWVVVSRLQNTRAFISSDMGQTWQSAFSSSGYGANLATDSQGNWVVVWQQRYSGSDYDIVFVRSADNGITWSTPTLLNSNGIDATSTEYDTQPVIATNNNGVWVCTWRTNYKFGEVGRSYDEDIAVSISYDDGATWSAIELLNLDGNFDKDDEYNLKIGFSDENSGYVFWDTANNHGLNDVEYVKFNLLTDTHSADINNNGQIELSELLRLIQYYNLSIYGCNPAQQSEDQYLPGNNSDITCMPHDSDFMPQDWEINLSELLRGIQFYNSYCYYNCQTDPQPLEDSFCPCL